MAGNLGGEPRLRAFAMLAVVCALAGLVSGLADAWTSRPVEVVTEVVRVRETVTEYRAVGPADAVEIASERKRLNRIKRRLHERQDQLRRIRRSLALREAALDEREEVLAAAQEEGPAAPRQRRDLNGATEGTR